MRSGRSSVLRRYPKGRILLDGSRAPDTFRIVVSGVVKLLHVDHEGRQQVAGLLFPGDYLCPTQPLIARLVAEAATPVEICCFPRRTFETLLRRNASLEPALLRHTLNELDDVRAWMRILAHRPAQERIARFLVELEQRTRSSPAEPRTDIIHLPLSRTELADYLGLTIETVSRQVTQLRAAGIIETSGRSLIQVKDWERLQALAAPGAIAEESTGG